MQSWRIDPNTGDYVLSGGAPVETNSLHIPAYFRLKVKRKTWLYTPNDRYGSDFYTLKKRPANNAGVQLENIALDALKPLIEDGRAGQIDANTDILTRNGAGMTVKITDASGIAETVIFTGLGV